MGINVLLALMIIVSFLVAIPLHEVGHAFMAGRSYAERRGATDAQPAFTYRSRGHAAVRHYGLPAAGDWRSGDAIGTGLGQTGEDRSLENAHRGKCRRADSCLGRAGL